MLRTFRLLLDTIWRDRPIIIVAFVELKRRVDNLKKTAAMCFLTQLHSDLQQMIDVTAVVIHIVFLFRCQYN